MLRRVLASVLVFAVVAGEIPARTAGVSALGVVTQASRATLARASVSAGSGSSGSTIYYGDSFTTASDGMLRLRTGVAQLFLTGESAIQVHSAPGGTIAQLTGGTVVFSSAKSSAVDIQFSEAHIC